MAAQTQAKNPTTRRKSAATPRTRNARALRRTTVAGASKRVGRAVTRTSGQVGKVVGNRLSKLGSRLRGIATAVTDAARTGVGAVKQVGAQMERRPLMTFAIALGIGFLAGITSSRSN